MSIKRLQSYLQNLADEIRKWTRTTEKINAQEFPLWMSVLYTTGSDDGYQSGYTSGYDEGEEIGYTIGFNEGHDWGYDSGKQAEYDRFWDAAQKNGDRTNYNFAFSGGMWSQATFKPKYPIRPTSAMNMFGYWGGYSEVGELIDLSDIDIDFSNCTDINNMFTMNKEVKAVGIINATKSGLQGTFNNAINLKSIEKLILKDEGTQSFSSTFSNCNSLENIVFEGVIGKNLDMRYSTNLTHDSLMSIINALKDYSADTSGTTYTLTIGGTNIAKLTEEELEIIRSKGWDYQ